jgi:site-specific DNA recombinase
MTMRVAIYTRISTDETNQPYSLEAQTVRLEQHIELHHGMRIVRRYTDQASGATTKRPGLQHALKDAEAGRYDLLLVYRLDRLSRSVQGTLEILEQLDTAGVAFRSATEAFETQTPTGKLLLQILAVIAEWERATIIDRVTAGLERKAARGEWPGGAPPPGYVIGEGSVLQPDEDLAHLPPLVFERYANHMEGARVIASWLTECGYRTRQGNPFSHEMILRMLRNRAYIGEIQRGDAVHPGKHVPLVERDLFDRAQAVLKQRGDDISLRRSNTSDYLLTGLVRCSRCGKMMVGTRSHGRSEIYRYYTCYTRHRYGTDSCDAERIPADKLETAVKEQVIAMLEDEPLVRQAVERAFAANETDRPRREADLAAIDRDIRKTRDALARYLDAFERETMPEKQCAPRVAELGAKLEALDARRQELTEDDEQIAAPSIEELHALAADVRDLVAHGDSRQIKALMQAYVREIRVKSRNEIYPSFYAPTVSPPSYSVGRAGIEPATLGLRVPCSTS